MAVPLKSYVAAVTLAIGCVAFSIAVAQSAVDVLNWLHAPDVPAVLSIAICAVVWGLLVFALFSLRLVHAGGAPDLVVEWRAVWSGTGCAIAFFVAGLNKYLRPVYDTDAIAILLITIALVILLLGLFPWSEKEITG